MEEKQSLVNRMCGIKDIVAAVLENLIFHSANNSNTGPPIQKHENNF